MVGQATPQVERVVRATKGTKISHKGHEDHQEGLFEPLVLLVLFVADPSS
jgi:hypothetical protein